MCDVAYVMQLRELEREVATIRAQATLMGATVDLPTAADAQASLDEWLVSPPATTTAAAGVPAEMMQLSEVLGVARR